MIISRPFFNTIALIAAVGLGFSIPLSNVLTNICVVILLLAWCFSGIKQKLKIIFQSKIIFVILLLLLVYIISILYTPATATEIVLMLRKMSRLLLIPIIMSIFKEAKWREFAFYSFWVAITVSLLIIIFKLTDVFSLSSVLYGLTEKFHLSCKSPNLAFRDRIFTSLLFSFATFSLLHYGLKDIKYCKCCCTKCFTVHRLPTKNICYLLLAAACFIYLIIYCDGRSGQVIGIGLIELFLLQKQYSWRKFILCNLLMFGCIFGVHKLQLSVNNSDRYELTFLEVKEYFKTKLANKEPISDVLEYFNITIVSNASNASNASDASNASNANSAKLLPLYYQSTGIRLEFLMNSLRLFKASPIIGHGIGSFRYVYNERFPLLTDDKQQLMVNNPHNQYILIAVELGLLGLVVLFGMFSVMLYECSLLPTLEKHLSQGVVFTIIVGCMANSWLLDFTSMHYFVYFLGVCFAAKPFKSNKISISTNN